MKESSAGVSASEICGPLHELTKRLAGFQGHYWLHQLNLFMRKDPTHVLTESWLKALEKKETWKKAKDYYDVTHELWFSEPEWPFQICAFNPGDMDNRIILKDWVEDSHHENEGNVVQTVEDLLPIEEKTVFLIRLQARFLFPHSAKIRTCRDVNHGRPHRNLSFCPRIIPFIIRARWNDCSESEYTFFSTSEISTQESGGNKVYYLSHDKGTYLGTWHMSPETEIMPNTWWIFEYNLPAF